MDSMTRSLVILAALLWVTPPANGAVVLEESFETTAIGSVPAGWTIPFPGVSIGVVDTQASSGSRSLRLVAGGFNGANARIGLATDAGIISLRYGLMIDSSTWNGSDGESKITLSQAGKFALAGVVKRGQDYYFFDAFSRQTSTIPAPVDQWIEIELVMNFVTDEAQAFFDGDLLFTSTLAESSGNFLQLNSGNGSTGGIAAFYDQIVVEELTAPPCRVYDFSDGIADEWLLTGVGHANQVSAEENSGALALTSDGATAYYGKDNAGFLYQELIGDFRIETDLDTAPMTTGKAWRKAGLMVRASLDHLDIRLLAMAAPVQERLQFVARESYGSPGNVKVATEVPGAPSALRLAIQRSAQELSIEYSNDGGVTWIRPTTGLGGSIEITALPENLLVGLAVVSNNISVTTTAEFDNVSICQ